MEIKRKKGVFFTIATITLISITVFLYLAHSTVNRHSANQKRVETLDNFVYQTQQDLNRLAYISGYRIIFLFEKRIVEKEVFFSNISRSSQELFFNGSIDGESQPLMIGATKNDIQTQIQENAKKINANFSMDNITIALIQETPWIVRVTLSMNITIQDKNNLVSWQKKENISVYIDINKFEDPLYIVYTSGAISKKIKKTPYEIFVLNNNTANLTDHLANTYYLATPLAPSFLDRFEGKTQSNVQGIESLVNLPQLSAQGIAVENKSIIDHIYFSTSNPLSYQVISMPSWFRIDSAHTNLYNVTDLLI